MFVAGAAVGVHVEFDEAFAKDFEGFDQAVAQLDVTTEFFVQALPVGRHPLRRKLRKVGVARVQAKADALEMANLHDLNEMRRRREIVRQIFQQKLHAERTGESFQVFDRRERVIERACAPLVILVAKVQDAGAKRDLLSGFECTLHLIHRFDARGFIVVDEVQRGRGVAAPLRFFVHRAERHVHRGFDVVGTEPRCYFFDSAAVGVVEVMP